MRANRLQLNTAKTEILWCSSSRRQHQIPTTPVRIGPTSILPVFSVTDLGVYLDADATMTTHVKATVRSCFAALRQIRSVRRSLSQHALLTLIRAPCCQQGRQLQLCVDRCLRLSPEQTIRSIMNAAARLIFYARRSEHVMHSAASRSSLAAGS